MTMKSFYIFILMIHLVLFSNATGWTNYSPAYIVNDMADDGSKIWVATLGGLSCFDRTTNSTTVYRPANSGLLANAIRSVKVDHNGVKWIAYYTSMGLCSYDGNNWINYELIPGMPKLQQIRAIRIDNLNRIWCQYSRNLIVNGFTVGDGGLAVFDHSNWTVFDGSTYPAISGGYDFDVDTLGNVWIGTGNGLVKFDGVSTILYDNLNSILLSNGIRKVFVDKNNIVWLQNMNYSNPSVNRIYSIDAGGNWTVYTSPQALKAARAEKVFVDQSNNKYYYNQADSIYKFDNISWSSLSSNYNQDARVSGLLMDSINTLWTICNLPAYQELRRNDGTTSTAYSLSADSLRAIYGRSIVADSSGNIWFVAETFLYKFDGNVFTSYSPPLPAYSHDFNKIIIDKFQNLWMCSDTNDSIPDDLMKFDGINWTIYPFGNLKELALDSAGNIWFISYPYPGCWLYKYDGSIFTSFDLAPFQNTTGGPIALTIDKLKRIWVACYNNVLVIDSNMNVSVIDASNSPINSHIYSWSVKADDYGYVWINGEDGCYRTNGVTWWLFDKGWFKGGGIFQVFSDNRRQIWIATGGNLCRFNGHGFDGYGYDNTEMGFAPYDAVIDKHGNLWLTGDFGPLSKWDSASFNETYYSDLYTLSGKVYYDLNSNKGQDTNEINIGYQKFQLQPDSILSFSSINGNYAFFTEGGNHEVKYIPNSNWQITTDSFDYHMNIQSDTCCFDFGINAIQQIHSASIDVAIPILRCFSDRSYYITVKNEGTDIFYPHVKLTKDSSLFFLSAYPAPIVNTANSMEWDVPALNPFQEIRLTIKLDVNAAAQTPELTSVELTDAVTQITFDSVVNVDTVLCSYDPNDKSVRPAGVLHEHFVLASDSLTYMIRFQNTGNDTAYLVVIYDTLSNDLDLNTFEVISSSHSYTIQLRNGAAEFRFENIYLPDSSANDELSCGFIKYRIRPKSGILPMTIINNKSYIQFDYNPLIETNNVFNTIVYSIPNAVNEIRNPFNVVIYPNPLKENSIVHFSNNHHESFLFKMYNVTGSVIFKKYTSDDIPLKGISSGMYIWSFENVKTNQTVYGKVIVP